jgi:hypothetical protein
MARTNEQRKHSATERVAARIVSGAFLLSAGGVAVGVTSTAAANNSGITSEHPGVPAVYDVRNDSPQTERRVRAIAAANYRDSFFTNFVLTTSAENTSTPRYKSFVKHFITATDNGINGPMQVTVGINPQNTMNFPFDQQKIREINTSFALDALSEMVDYGVGPDAGGPAQPLDTVFIADGGAPKVSAQENAQLLHKAGFDNTSNQDFLLVTGLAFSDVNGRTTQVGNYFTETVKDYDKTYDTLIAPAIAEY